MGDLEETLMEKTPKELLEEISQIGKTEKLRVQELNAAIEEVSVHVRFFPQNAEQLICTSPERSQQEGGCLPLCSSGRGHCGTAPRKKLQEIQRRGVSQWSRCHALEDRIFRNRIRGREATVANVLLMGQAWPRDSQITQKRRSWEHHPLRDD